MKITIGEQEYELPFKQYESTIRHEIQDASGVIVCTDVANVELGQFIVAALNAYGENERLQNRIAELEEVLSFYADDNNWFEGGCSFAMNPIVGQTGSWRAKQVLEK